MIRRCAWRFWERFVFSLGWASHDSCVRLLTPPSRSPSPFSHANTVGWTAKRKWQVKREWC